MNVQRGDVVLVDYPYAAGGGTKVRPALVVQNDRDNQRLLNTIVAQITSVTRRALEPTQLLIEIATPAGQQSGLRQNSVVNGVNPTHVGPRQGPPEAGELAGGPHSTGQ